MNKLVIFIQGEGDYQADAKLVASLRASLGEAYEVRYPQMLSDETLSDFVWPQQIGKEMTLIQSNVFLAGHSLGASLLLKYLSENKIEKKAKKIGCRGLNCKKIPLINYQKIFQFFSTIAEMMKKYHFPIFHFIGKSCHRHLSAKLPAVGINLTTTWRS